MHGLWRETEIFQRVVGVDAKLTNGVRIGERVAGVAHTVHVGSAVEVVGDLSDAGVAGAVDLDVLLWGAEGVNDATIRSAAGSVVVLHARSQIEQGVYVAVHQGKVVDLDVADGASERGVAGVHQGNIGGDFDGLASGSDLQLKVEAGVLQNAERDSGPVEGLKAGGSYRDLVGAYGKKLFTVGAISFGLSAANIVRFSLRQCDGCTGYGRAGGVGDRA